MSEYKVIFKTVGLISLLGLIFAISLSIVFENSYPIIEKNKSDFKKKLLDQILLGVDYNNNILESFIEIEANELLKKVKVFFTDLITALGVMVAPAL